MRPQGWSGSAAPLPPTKYSPPCGLFVLCYASSARRTSSRTHCAPFSLYNASIRRTAASLAAFASLSFFPPPALRCGPVRRPQPQPAPSTQKGFASPCFPALPALCAGSFRLLCALARLLIHFDNVSTILSKSVTPSGNAILTVRKGPTPGAVPFDGLYYSTLV